MQSVDREGVSKQQQQGGQVLTPNQETTLFYFLDMRACMKTPFMISSLSMSPAFSW